MHLQWLVSNDQSSATRRTRSKDCNRDAPAEFAAAHWPRCHHNQNLHHGRRGDDGAVIVVRGGGVAVSRLACSIAVNLSNNSHFGIPHRGHVE